MSGRSLRRIPVLAHARYIASGHLEDMEEVEIEGSVEQEDGSEGAESEDGEDEDPEAETLEMWLWAMTLAAKAEKGQMALIQEAEVQ